MRLHQEILQLIDFGADVAENDTGLSDYFVETSDFSTILSGSVDIIRGHKGLGKSAIYRTLLSGKYTPPQTLIISASDATSSGIFRETQTEAATEDQFRLLWTAYLATTIANEVVAKIRELPNTKSALKEIREFLKTFRLGNEKTRPGLMEAIRNAKSLGLGLGVSPEGTPSLSFTLELDGRTDKVLVSEEHFLRLIDLCVGAIRTENLKLWVLIDRLDELFQKNSTNEILSLRGLFRSHLNLCAIRHGQTDVRCKIFIRTDIYDRITRREGFTNVTHFRDLNIVWNARSMVALVARRTVSNPDVREKLQRLGVDTNDPNHVWDVLLPLNIQNARSHIWIAKATMDASGAFNPRNYITLLSLAAKKNIELLRTNPRGIPADVVLSADAILSSLGELSRKRLDDTVLAEFPDARPLVDRLRGGTATFESLSQLAQVLGIDANDVASLESAIDRLGEIGLLRRITFSTSSIAYLYRPALRAGGNTTRSTKGEL